MSGEGLLRGRGSMRLIAPHALLGPNYTGISNSKESEGNREYISNSAQSWACAVLWIFRMQKHYTISTGTAPTAVDITINHYQSGVTPTYSYSVFQLVSFSLM